jgi:hypothetical protein
MLASARARWIAYQLKDLGYRQVYPTVFLASFIQTSPLSLMRHFEVVLTRFVNVIQRNRGRGLFNRLIK